MCKVASPIIMQILTIKSHQKKIDTWTTKKVSTLFFSKNSYDDLNATSTNDNDLNQSNVAEQSINNAIQIGNNGDSVMEASLEINNGQDKNDPLAIYDPDNENFDNLSMLD